MSETVTPNSNGVVVKVTSKDRGDEVEQWQQNPDMTLHWLINWDPYYLTLSLTIMEVENYPKGKETTIRRNHFSLP